MRTLAKMTWVEIKLFVREPVTVFFAFALPLLMLFVLGEVFGNTPDPEGEVFRGIGPMDYCVPAYVGLVLRSIGMLALPVHLAGYRERGVLRRFRASAVSVWAVIGAQVFVMRAAPCWRSPPRSPTTFGSRPPSPA
jgi:ABC-2 type transport system permease protein